VWRRKAARVPTLAPTWTCACPHDADPSDQCFQLARFRRRLRLVDRHITTPNSSPPSRPRRQRRAHGDQLTRHCLEQGVTGAMAMAVVDGLEAVEVDEHKRGLRAIPLHIGNRAFEFALKTTTVEDIEQWIDVGARLELSNARARNGNLALKAFDLGQ
jgi:hypothetical protein